MPQESNGPPTEEIGPAPSGDTHKNQPNSHHSTRETSHLNGALSSEASGKVSKALNTLIKALPQISLPENPFLKGGVIVFIGMSYIMSALVGYNIDFLRPTPVAKHIPLPTPLPLSNLKQVVTMSYASPQGITGYIHDVTIVGYDSYAPNALHSDLQMHFCYARYNVEGTSTEESFVDLDEGTKTNSVDVYRMCQEYAEVGRGPYAGKPVSLVVSGTRDTQKTLFRNILQFLPQGK